MFHHYFYALLHDLALVTYFFHDLFNELLSFECVLGCRAVVTVVVHATSPTRQLPVVSIIELSIVNCNANL